MVVFVDLDSDEDADPLSLQRRLESPRHNIQRAQVLQQTSVVSKQTQSQNCIQVGAHVSSEREDRCADLFASALAAYPISLSLTAFLDLNDLFSLSSTCRKLHDSVIQFAHQLRTQSLRCVNDTSAPPSNVSIDNETVGDIFRDAIGQELAHIGPAFPLPFTSEGSHFYRTSQSTGLTGRHRKCARDMVAPCRRCGTTVCRNCAAKPPSDRCLPERFRRLCRTCLDVPLNDHLQPLSNDYRCGDILPDSSSSSARSVRSLSSASFSSNSHAESEHESEHGLAFTAPSFLRDPCNCTSSGVYLCQPCGQGLHAADTTYKRVWTWRSRYSTHIGGGLGTGLGLGNEGQKCGRGEQCLEKGAMGVCWVEIECSETRAHINKDHGSYTVSASSASTAGDRDIDLFLNKPGYLSQEIEGIGGVVKKKVKKRVKVGATVYEYDDERESAKYLEREASGQQRGWCGWCFRVCPARDDQ